MIYATLTTTASVAPYSCVLYTNIYDGAKINRASANHTGPTIASNTHSLYDMLNELAVTNGTTQLVTTYTGWPKTLFKHTRDCALSSVPT